MRPRFVALIAPLAAVFVLQQTREDRRDLILAETAQRKAAFQLTDVEGVFAGTAVTLPASPDIDLYHDCRTENRQAVSTCRTMLRSADRIRLQEGLPSPPVIHQIHIRPGGSDQAAWCGKRPKLAMQGLTQRVWDDIASGHDPSVRRRDRCGAQ